MSAAAAIAGDVHAPVAPVPAAPLAPYLLSAQVAIGSAFITVLVLVFLIVGLSVWQTRRAAEQGLVNLSLELERGVVKDLLAYDFMLQSVARSVRAGDAAAAAGQVELWRQLRTPDLGYITILDAAGQPVGGEVLTDSARADLAASLAVHHARPDAALHAGTIGPGRTGHMRLLLSRRLDDAQGRFAGIVAGSVKLAYFRRALPTASLGSGGAVSLLTLDGRLVAATSMRKVSSGQDLSRSNVMERLRAKGPGVFTAVSVLDGQERLYSAVQLTGLPLYLVTGRFASEVYADWNLRALASAALLAGLTALLGLLCWALYEELARRRLAERGAQEVAHRAGSVAAELELVTHNSDDLILKIDWNGTRQFVSPACERMLGHTAAELLQQDALAFVHEDDKALLSATLRDLHAGRRGMAQVTYRLRHRSGAWLNVEARVRALPDGSGAVVGVRDVTQRIALEEKLRQAQKMEGIGQLTAGVAHDFNNMLQGQIAGLELLADLVADRKEASALAEGAIVAAERGARLTHSLLAFARKQVLRPEPIDLARLLMELEALLTRTLGPHVALETRIGPGVAQPLADPVQLQSALLNLCLNARDAMRGQGGRILLEARALPGDPRTVVLAVTDDGPGIAPDIIARVCEPFFTTKGLGEGSGLGLSMVQGFAQQSGGELQIRSPPGRGTTAEIRLPGVPAQPASSLAAERAARPTRTGRLLLVDDDAAVLENLVEVLRRAGYAVVPATCATEAEQVLRGGEPLDMLITDYGMPGPTGLDLLRRARLLRPGLRMLLMTGYLDMQHSADLPEKVRVLHKPFRADELLAEIADPEPPGLLAA